MDTEESRVSLPNPELLQRDLKEFNEKVAGFFNRFGGNNKRIAIETDDGPKTVQLVWHKDMDMAYMVVIDSNDPIQKSNGQTTYLYRAIVSRHEPDTRSPLLLDYHVGEMHRTSYGAYIDPFVADVTGKRRVKERTHREQIYGKDNDRERLHEFMGILDQIKTPAAQIKRLIRRPVRITPPVKSGN